MSDPHAQLAARAIVAILDDDPQVHEMVLQEVVRTDAWKDYSAALAAFAAAICRQIDDQDGSRALWLHAVAATL